MQPSRVRLLAAGTLAAIAFALYFSTLLPGQDLGDTASFQAIADDRLLTPRQGYPLYFALNGLFVHALPAEAARATNLASAVAAALAVGLARFGVTVEEMAPGLAHFTGAERRFQRIGTARGVTVVDDYAHHPTEIRATLSAARLAFPQRRLVIAFQPHLFSRTRDFAADFGRALAKADQLFLADIYPAREQPIDGVTSQLIADSATISGRRPAWMGERAGLAQALAEFVKEGDVVLTVGAGDITKTGPELLAMLGATA